MKVKFYLTQSGRSPVEEFLTGCSPALRSDFFDATSLLAAGRSLAMPLSRSLAGIHKGLHEVRLKDRSGRVRVFYFVKKREAIYMLHAIRKKAQRLRKRDVDLIKRRLKEI